MTFTKKKVIPPRTVVRVRRIPVFYIWVSTCLLLGVNFYQINLLQKEKSEQKTKEVKREILTDKKKINITSSKLVIDRSILEQSQRFYTGPGSTIVRECGLPLTLDRANASNLKHSDRTKVWPSLQAANLNDDRIIAQMHYFPKQAEENQMNNKQKLIYVAEDLMYEQEIPPGNEKFSDDECLVNTCSITSSVNELPMTDAAVFNDIYDVREQTRKTHNQVWVYYNLESPENLQGGGFKNIVNWTATYRRDSTIVTPYEKFVPFDDTEEFPRRTSRNYAAGKTKMVAWFVSNCSPSNKRDKYAKELARYVDVDIYGSCGRKKCPKSNSTACDDLLSQRYKFYLSFENSNCQDYITEKFFRNGLSNDIVPIVMGARSEEYARVAPPGSYIHVEDFRSPRDLAHYLQILNEDDDLYNEYFRWKGTGDFINTKFWCRLCAMLHDGSRLTWYRNFRSWWNPPGICTNKWHWKSRWQT